MSQTEKNTSDERLGRGGGGGVGVSAVIVEKLINAEMLLFVVALCGIKLLYTL